MHEVVFAPGELAPRRHLYVVKWGVVLHGGKVLTFGKLWGEVRRAGGCCLAGCAGAGCLALKLRNPGC